MSLGETQLLWVWPEWLLLALGLALLAGWLERRSGSGRAAALQRAAVLALVGLALARPALDAGRGQDRLVLVDRSDSVAGGAAEALLAAGSVLADAPRMDFGGPADSPLAEALDLAGRALPAGGSILLLGDGRWTAPAEAGPGIERRDPAVLAGPAERPVDPLEVAARLAAEGIRIDALPLPGRGGLDLAVTRLDLPSSFRAGERVRLDLRLRATGAAAARLRVERLGAGAPEELARRELELAPGETSLSLELQLAEPGPLRLVARLEAEGDVQPANDRLEAAAWVAPPMSVLVLGEGEGAVRLADLLAGEGITATLQAPALLSSRLSQLEAWDATVLADVPASALGLDQQQALEAFVADLGGGLLLTGGRQSFLPGGWERTPLAELAPVDLDPPARAAREAVALLILIDQSASMGSVEGRGAISKLALAREAALLAAEVLGPGDRVGVLTYDDAARWLLPPTAVGAGRELAEVEAALSGLATGGGTRILAALELGLPALVELEELPTRHAVLLSDGRDADADPGPQLAAVRAAREAGVTLSTIAIGSDADRELLAQLARAGRGRYHWAAEPGDLPRLAVEESEIIRARSEQRGSFRAAPPRGAAPPLLAGVDVAALPPVGGYLAVRPRPGAEVVLQTAAGDPLLAGWQLGLGRVLAWTSDLGEAWALDWPASSAGRGLWLAALRHVARAPDAGPPGLAIWPLPEGAFVSLDLLDRAGRPIDLASASLVLAGAEAAEPIALPQLAPGRYGARVRLERAGAWPARVEVVAEGQRWSLPLALARPYAPELEPRTTEEGRAALAALAAAGRGRLLGSPDELGEASGPQRGRRLELWPWLLAAAALLWLAEVARLTDLLRGWRPGGGRIQSASQPPGSRAPDPEPRSRP